MIPPRAGPPRRPTGRQLTGRRRTGATAVIAMIFMVLFAALAVGFYAQTTISAQIGHNELRMLDARTAAESGMEFMRYQLSLVQVPPLTPDEQVMDVVYKHLSESLECTGNLGSHLVYINGGATKIEVPEGEKNYISLYENGPRFRAIIKRKGRELVVTTVGSAAASGSFGGKAGVELTFRPDQERGRFFSYGMASKGTISINPSDAVVQGVPGTYANILSTSTAANPVTIGAAGNTKTTGIAGTITVLEGTTPALLGPVSVDGETIPAKILDPANKHVKYIKPEKLPEFPVADTSVFRKYATNAYVAGKTQYDNTLVPPNTNPTFDASMTIRGVLYIQQPNVVRFQGSVKMQCVVATEDKNVGTLATNVLQFTGNGGTKQRLSTLPYESQFEGLHQLTGAFVVAPGFDVQFTGNFGAVVGDICGDRISFTGNTTANVTGSVFTLKPFPISVGGSVSLTLQEDPASLHSGIRHTESFARVASTWREVVVP
jgi:hypothetical protein